MADPPPSSGRGAGRTRGDGTGTGKLLRRGRVDARVAAVRAGRFRGFPGRPGRGHVGRQLEVYEEATHDGRVGQEGEDDLSRAPRRCGDGPRPAACPCVRGQVRAGQSSRVPADGRGREPASRPHRACARRRVGAGAKNGTRRGPCTGCRAGRVPNRVTGVARQDKAPTSQMNAGGHGLKWWGGVQTRRLRVGARSGSRPTPPPWPARTHGERRG